MTKKIISAAMAITLVFGAAGSVLPKANIFDTAITASADFEPASGEVDGLKWSIDEQGTMTISGNGALKSKGDWNADHIVKLVLEEGITGIECKELFSGCINLNSVEFPDSLTQIQEGAFKYCDGSTIVTIPENVTFIGGNVFDKCKICVML